MSHFIVNPLTNELSYSHRLITGTTQINRHIYSFAAHTIAVYKVPFWRLMPYETITYLNDFSNMMSRWIYKFCQMVNGYCINGDPQLLLRQVLKI